MTIAANKAFLLAIVRASMRVLDNAARKGDGTSNSRGINETIKVNPLSAILRPCFPPKRLANAAGENGLFQRSEMLADHKRSLPPNDPASDPALLMSSLGNASAPPNAR